MVEQFVNSGGPDQTSHSSASDLGLHCLPVTLLGVSRLQCVKYYRVYQWREKTIIIPRACAGCCQSAPFAQASIHFFT